MRGKHCSPIGGVVIPPSVMIWPKDHSGASTSLAGLAGVVGVVVVRIFGGKVGVVRKEVSVVGRQRLVSLESLEREVGRVNASNHSAYINGKL